MCMCVYVYIYTHIYIYIYRHVCVCISAQIQQQHQHCLKVINTSKHHDNCTDITCMHATQQPANPMYPHPNCPPTSRYNFLLPATAALCPTLLLRQHAAGRILYKSNTLRTILIGCLAVQIRAVLTKQP
jgi:hypothetical protein